MRTEDIEQFDEELWNIVKSGMLRRSESDRLSDLLGIMVLASLNKVEF